MKNLLRVGLPIVGVVFLMGPEPAFAQACKDEEAMVEDYKKSILDLVETVKKETLPEFERAYHQKNCLTKLTLSVSLVDGLVSCLEKAAQDPAALKQDVQTYKTKRETYVKLKEKVQQNRDALKTTATGKDAKALIEKIDLSN